MVDPVIKDRVERYRSQDRILIAAHILALPWGIIGVASYYSLKTLLRLKTTEDPTSADLGKVIEFELAFWAGPLALPLVIVGLVGAAISVPLGRVRDTLSKKRKQMNITSAAQRIQAGLERFDNKIVEKDQPLFKQAREAVQADLECLAASPDRNLGASSAAAVETLVECTKHLSQEEQINVLLIVRDIEDILGRKLIETKDI